MKARLPRKRKKSLKNKLVKKHFNKKFKTIMTLMGNNLYLKLKRKVR